MRVVAFPLNSFDRAEVISEVSESGKVKLFFTDYGTKGTTEVRRCKMLMEQFAMVPRQAVRVSLFGIKPVGDKSLWDVNITTKFIEEIHDKIHKIQIVKYHEKVS
jgi:hypothetical protein